MATNSIIESLRQQILSCEAQLQDLRQRLAEAENRRYQQLEEEEGLRRSYTLTANDDPLSHDMNHGIADAFCSEVYAALSPHTTSTAEQTTTPAAKRAWPLDKAEYKRYGRQLIMPEVGLQGQLRLKNASVLVVGVGGLGCPAAAYLAGAGVGKLGLVDGDVVEESNLHRQILHSTSRIGMFKVDSAMVYLNSLNPNVDLIPYRSRLTPETALDIVRNFDLVLDCTDTPASRYLISDACILLGKTLVSASALRTDGQLMVLNNPPKPPGDPTGGPCYRCVFPRPPPPESVVSCGDGGILGPVVGVMGVLQALEAIKVLTRRRTASSSSSSASPSSPSSLQTSSSDDPVPPPDPPTLIIFSAYANPQFRSIRLRARKPRCATCSSQATVTREALVSGSLDYVQFCGAVAPVDALTPSERISVENYAKLRGGQVNPFLGREARAGNHVLVDVRERVQFGICGLEGSVNVPFSVVSSTPISKTAGNNGQENENENGMMEWDSGNGSGASAEPHWVKELRGLAGNDKPIFVVCRLGNDSQVAVRKMKEWGLDFGGKRWIGDIKGGLRAWRENVDPEFPEY